MEAGIGVEPTAGPTAGPTAKPVAISAVKLDATTRLSNVIKSFQDKAIFRPLERSCYKAKGGGQVAMALSSGNTLFEAVPALSTVAKQGAGVLKMIPLSINLTPIELHEGINRIGRDPEQAEHVINGTQVSRLHCAVVVDGVDIWVRDLGSHNGTYINRERVNEGPAKPGDEVSVSRMATFRLVMDEDLAQVEAVNMIGMEDDDEGERTRVAAPNVPPASPQQAVSQPAVRQQAVSPPPVPQQAAFQQAATTPPPAPQPTNLGAQPHRESTSSQPMLREMTAPRKHPPAEDDSELTIEQIEKQRNVLAILYQISLRCLMASDIKEREQLLSNVLPRLTSLDAGFILYQTEKNWRASICPDRQQPPDPLVKACFRLARRSLQPVNLKSPRELHEVGLSQGGAMVVPLVIDDKLVGVIGAISHNAPFSDDDFDIVTQIGNVTAAALQS